MILGNNINWPDGLSDNERAMADKIAPTALRYPGGANSYFYHWKDAIGPVAGRKAQRHQGGDAVVEIGTDEFLALAKRWNSTPLITLNIMIDDEREAVEWLRYTDKKGPVTYWEIGNEPYLKDQDESHNIAPDVYIPRANKIIQAMKAENPSVKVGIPLRNDTLGGLEATPYKGYNNKVLQGITQPFDFVSVHGSYFPVAIGGSFNDDEMYLAATAGTMTMKDDIDQTRALLKQYYPGKNIPIAVTEYNALFTLDIARMGIVGYFISKTDKYIKSMAGAQYVADALIYFAKTPDILMANFWSLNKNWHFGAIDQSGNPTPSFKVLEAFRQFAGKPVIGLEIQSPTVATKQVGFSQARSAMPLISALAVRDGNMIRMIVINKSPDEAINVKLSSGNAINITEFKSLHGNEPFDDEAEWENLKPNADGVTLPAASVSVVILN